jgi:hypothetical protein
VYENTYVYVHIPTAIHTHAHTHVHTHVPIHTLTVIHAPNTHLQGIGQDGGILGGSNHALAAPLFFVLLVGLRGTTTRPRQGIPPRRPSTRSPIQIGKNTQLFD